MNRFTVSEFASKRYGQSPSFGFRIFDHNTDSPLFIASFPTQDEAQTVADLLNSHTDYYAN